ncbi:MAG TPA: hypothetical protein VGM69_02635 [Chloroflexota bacterium]
MATRMRALAAALDAISSAEREPDALLADLAERARTVLGCDAASVHLDDAAPTSLVVSGRTIRAPLVAGERTLGVLVAEWRTPPPNGAALAPIAEALARGAAAALQAGRRLAEERAARAEAVRARPHARALIAALQTVVDASRGEDADLAARAKLDGAVKTARLVAHGTLDRLARLAELTEELAEALDPDDQEIAWLMRRDVEAAGEVVRRLQELSRFEEIDASGMAMLDLPASAAEAE